MPGRNITNPIELHNALATILKDVINSVSKDLLKALQERIMMDVYLYDPRHNHWYYNKSGKPTMQFYNAFKWGDIAETVNDMTRELFYDWQSLKLDTATFLHGDPVRGDMRQQLADLLNVSGFDDGFFGGKLRNEFWTHFIDEFINDQKELDFLFAKYLEKYQSTQFG
jgi:hypothetical protein